MTPSSINTILLILYVALVLIHMFYGHRIQTWLNRGLDIKDAPRDGTTILAVCRIPTANDQSGEADLWRRNTETCDSVAPGLAVVWWCNGASDGGPGWYTTGSFPSSEKDSWVDHTRVQAACPGVWWRVPRWAERREIVEVASDPVVRAWAEAGTAD